MADIVDGLREGLAERLRVLGDGIQVNAYVLSNPTPPAALVKLGPIDYDGAMGRSFDTWTFLVLVLVGAQGDIGAQKKLGEYVAPFGAKSVKAVLEADQTLGGVAYSVDVTDCTGQEDWINTSTTAVQAPPYVGAVWTVRVRASGKE